jgi:hypothetical protein
MSHTIFGRLFMFWGVTVCFGALLLFALTYVNDWVAQVTKRRHRIQQTVRLASGQHARVIQPTPPPAAALAYRAQRDREITLLERQLNMRPPTGVND